LEPRVGPGVRRTGTARPTPPALPRQGRTPRMPGGYAEPAQEVGDGLGPLALLQPHTAQLPANPAVQGQPVTLTGRVAEVGHPTGQERVEVTDRRLAADPSAPTGDLPDAGLGALQTLRGDAQRAAPEK